MALPPPYPWRSIKTFLLGLTLFAVGGFLLGISFILLAMGSSLGNPSGSIGAGLMIVGFLIAVARLS